MLIKSSPTRGNLSNGYPSLGSKHAHWHEVSPKRHQDASDRSSALAAFNRQRREEDKRYFKALANGARVLGEVKS